MKNRQKTIWIVLFSWAILHGMGCGGAEYFSHSASLIGVDKEMSGEPSSAQNSPSGGSTSTTSHSFTDNNSLVLLKGYNPYYSSAEWESLQYKVPKMSFLDKIREVALANEGKTYNDVFGVWFSNEGKWCSEGAAAMYRQAGMMVPESVTTTDKMVNWFQSHSTHMSRSQFESLFAENGRDLRWVQTMLLPGTYLRQQRDEAHTGHSVIVLDSKINSSGKLMITTLEANVDADPVCVSHLSDPDDSYKCTKVAIRERDWNSVFSDDANQYQFTDIGLASGSREPVYLSNSDSNDGYNSKNTWDRNGNTYWYSKTGESGQLMYTFDNSYRVRSLYIHADATLYPQSIQVYKSNSGNCSATSNYTIWSHYKTYNVSFGGKYTLALQEDGSLEGIDMKCLKIKLGNNHGSYNKIYEVRAFR